MLSAERYNVANAIGRWVVSNTLAWIGDFNLIVDRSEITIAGAYRFGRG